MSERACAGCEVRFCPLPGRPRPTYCEEACALRCRHGRFGAVSVSARAYRRLVAAAAARGVTVRSLVEDAVMPALGGAA